MQKRPLFPLLLLPFVWGCYYMATAQAVAALSVLPAGIVIRLVALVLLTMLLLFKKQFKTLGQIKHVWPKLLLIGTLGFLLDVTAFIGLSMCPAGIGTALLKCDVLFVNLISVFFYHYRFHARDWLCTGAMLLGVFLVLDVDVRAARPSFGYVFFLLSALFVSINAFLIQSAQHDRENPAGNGLIAYYNNLVTLVLFLLFSLFSGDIARLAKPGDSGAGLPLLLAGLGQALVYLFYYDNLRQYPVWLVKAFLLLMPVVTAGLSLLLFGEQITAGQWAGIAVLLGGAGGLLFAKRQREAS